MAVFDRSGVFDPVTVQFGRVFASLRERRGHRYYRVNEPKATQLQRRNLMRQFFGGSIEFGREEEFVKALDGRKIPFSVLSSGQQELLPLWMVVDEFSDYPRYPVQIFIEEPEAHLFPSSQSDITAYLASLATNKKLPRKILITTHSPYVLASINNLLKAGELANKLPKSAEQEIASIIPRRSWLDISRLRGYALKDGEVQDICKEGLLDADYIDDVSGKIASEFADLLEIENRKWPLRTVNAEQPTRG